MELILKEDVQDLGFKDDIVTVKNGYGRNFLIPQGLATLATRFHNLQGSLDKGENPKVESLKERTPPFRTFHHL